MKYIKYVALSIFLFSSVISKCDEGWDYIKDNDNKQARVSFDAKLKKDSTDLHSLLGIVYLSEVEQDKHRYKKAINTLLRHHYSPHYYALFGHVCEIPLKQLIELSTTKDPNYSFFKFLEGNQRKEQRKFNESAKINSSISSDLKWSYLGPFKNIAGSGHIKEYLPELEPFDDLKKYDTRLHFDLNWVTPDKQQDDGGLYFENHLPEKGLNTYYANSFFECEVDQKVTFRITRKHPLKIWLDDQLIFEDPELIKKIWDNEQVTLVLKKGVHRLLVKSSEMNSGRGKYYLFSHYDYIKNFSEASLYFRICKENGTIIRFKAPASKEYAVESKYTPVVSKNKTSNYFSAQIDASPEQLFNYYAYCKSLFRDGNFRDAEAYFVKQLRINPKKSFFKYLAAKIYARNGKIERVYEVLNNIDHEKTPFFDILLEEFEELDMKNQEDEWVARLKQLETITPANYDVIKSYLKYYENKNLTDERESYIKQCIKKFPEHKRYLEFQLEKSNKPKEATSDKEKKKTISEAKSNIHKRFLYSDYFTLLKHYKKSDNKNKVLFLYDELIKYEPYESKHYLDKAKFLYSKEMYDEALQNLSKLLKVSPFDYEAYEMIGDIEDDRQNKQKALNAYSMAKKYSFGGQYSLFHKIEKLAGQKKFKHLFDTPEFSHLTEIDTGWKKIYKNEDAVVLLYAKDFVIDSSQHYEIYQKMLIKILSKNGVKEWTEGNLSFMGKLGHVKVIKPNGAEIRPDVNGSYVVCKNLAPGDLIEIEGTRKDELKFGELGMEKAYMHYFTFSAPIYKAKLEIAVPTGQYLGSLTKCVNVSYTTRKDSGYHFHRWDMVNLPAKVNEEAEIDELDTYNYIMNSTMKDWSPLVEWYADKTYKKLESNYEIIEIIDSIVKPAMNDEAIIEAIYNYITSEIQYSYVSFLQSNFTPKAPDLTCSAKIGDCKDVATMMITMLRYLGYEAYYVLVKSNHYDHAEILPSIYFDHVIVGYDLHGKTHFVDLTSDYFPHQVLLNTDVGAVGLKIKEGTTKTFRLPNDHLDKNKNLIDLKIDASLNKDRSILIDVKAIYPGYAGGNLRETLTRLNEEERKNFIIDHTGSGKFDHQELISYSFENLEDISTPLHINYKFEAKAFTQRVLDYIVFPVPYITNTEYNAVFSSEHRINGIDLGKITEIQPTHQTITLNFPDNYHLAKTPADISIDNVLGSYEVSFKPTNSGLQIEKTQLFNQQFVSGKEFENLKSFYFQLLDADATLIPVLTR